MYGKNPLYGAVRIQGSKNAVLPILTGALLIPGKTVIHNCPKILDTYHMIDILKSVGCIVKRDGSDLLIDAEKIFTCEIPAASADKMRSSIIFLGAMLGRRKEAKIPYPGGCVIGKRPFDFHIDALTCMGAMIERKESILYGKTEKLHGERIDLKFPSVGATENIILAAVLADGITEIHGAAKEPEIFELCRFLNGAGAIISGAGSETIIIQGVDYLHDSEYTIVPDRIVAGTYCFAVAATRGTALLEEVPVEQMKSIVDILKRMGCTVAPGVNTLYLDAKMCNGPIPYLATDVYPGFPTDLQSPLMSVLCTADGVSQIKETIFEGRFRVAQELGKMGAVIEIEEQKARIYGSNSLHGESVSAQELRGGAALVIAGLCATGKTTISNAFYIGRGYEDICGDLKALGAKIAYRP